MKIVSTAESGPAMKIALGVNATTRKIHRLCGSSSWCGASRKNYIATIQNATKASSDMYCEKCFPNGKPAALFEVEI